MLSVVELFKEDGTVDELGIGSIRDSTADALFPGTSVLLTRSRSLLMIPWLLGRVVNSSTDPREAAAKSRRLEGRLILSLLQGGEHDGVMDASRSRTSSACLELTPTGCFASTSPRAQTCPAGAPATSPPCKPLSTAGPERSLTGRRPPRNSTSSYVHCTQQVLQAPVEPGEYSSHALERELRRHGAFASMGSVADCFDNALAESVFAPLECDQFDQHPGGRFDRRRIGDIGA